MTCRHLIQIFVLTWSLTVCAHAAKPADAMWIYKTAAVLTDDKAQTELFEFCAVRNIKDLFWQTKYNPTPGAAKGGAVVIGNAETLRPFLKKATARGLRIHALSGDPSYAEAGKGGRAMARTEATLTFNREGKADERFAGVHFDIEPHGLKAWHTASLEEKCTLLTRLVEVCAAAAERVHSEDAKLQFGADVTFWFDKAKEDGSAVYPVTFRGKTKDATKHLLDVSDNLGIMSYRNTAEGKNGLTALVKRTINYADTSHGRAYVGVKMADIGPPMEGFFGSSEAEMKAAIQPVRDAYDGHRGYAGIAYFMYEAFRVMPRTRSP